MPFRRTRRRTRRQPVALKAVKRLAKFVDTELHQVDVVANFVNVTNASVIHFVNPIAVGTDRVDRTGDQASMRNLEVRFDIRVGTNDSILRMIIFADRQTNGAVPALADVISDDTFPTTSPLNIDNKRRFKILSDRCYRSSATGGFNVTCHRKFHKLMHKQRFDGGSGAITDVVSGAVHCMSVSDQAGGANSPSLLIYTRCTFAP